MRGKVLLAIAVVLLSAGSAAARWGMPEPLTERGQVVEDIYVKITIAGVLTFVLVFVLLVWVLARYREGSGNGRATHEKHRGSLAAEMTWILVPLVVVLWIGYIAYAGLVTLDRGHEDAEPELSIQVTGYQFAWEMDYGGGVKVLINPSIDSATGEVTYPEQFHIPADVPVLFNITSGDVIHAFNVMDENRAYVSIDDANPGGPHKLHQQIHVLPAGLYHVQCKEMCGPGHAYMRAEILVEPQEDFDQWLAEKTLAAGADLVQKVHVVADVDSLTTDGITTENGVDFLRIVAGTRVILEVENTADQPVDINLTSTFLGTIPAHSTGLLAFNTSKEAPGDRNIIGSNGGRLTFRAIQAEVVEVDLGAYRIIPQDLNLKAGTTYLVQVKNVHNAAHNLYIGDMESGDLAHSATIGGGASTSFTWTAETGTFDMWCAVPGHADLGMVGTVTVS
ncbi:MAG: plastocyanin/azurin family copper-binding protein [Thermoplasmatota archaeon]